MKSLAETKEGFIQLGRDAISTQIDHLLSIVPWDYLRHELDFECFLLGYWSNCWKTSSWNATISCYFYGRVLGGKTTQFIAGHRPTVRTSPLVDKTSAEIAMLGRDDAVGSMEVSPLPWWLLTSCCTSSAFIYLLGPDLIDPHLEYAQLLPLVLPDSLLPKLQRYQFLGLGRSREELLSESLCSDDPWKFPRVIVPSGMLITILSGVARSGGHECPRLYDRLYRLRPVLDDIEPVLHLLPLIRDPQWSSFTSQAVLRTKSYNQPVKTPETFKELIDQAVTI